MPLYRKRVLSILALIAFISCQALASEVIFPYHNEVLPVIEAETGEPLTIDLLDFIEGMDAAEVTNVSSAHQDENVTVFREAGDPFALAIIYPGDFSGLTFFPIRFDFKSGDHSVLHLPVRIKAGRKHSFQYKPEKKPDKVFVAGTFNGWNAGKDAMTDEDGDGVYETTLKLEPGRHLYKFVVDGNWVHDPKNPEKEDDGRQGFNSILKIGGEGAGAEPARMIPYGLKKEKDGDLLTYDFYYLDENGGAPLDPEEVAVLLNNEKLSNFSRSGDVISVPVPKKIMKGRTLRVFAASKKGVWSRPGFASMPADNEKGESMRDWRDAIIYFAFTDRFLNGDKKNDDPVKDDRLAERANWHGGDFAGIQEKIKEGYFEKLGVNVIWISPVNENADGAWRDSEPPNRYFTGYHGYWPISPRKTEPRFGSLKELKKLVKTAHENDVAIILDFVSNHTHKNHDYFQKHRDWYGVLDLPDGEKNIRLFDAHPFTTWFDTFLPSFDYPGSPDAQKQVISDALWWLKETGADGFRHDATKHIPLDFWKQLCRSVRREIELPAERSLLEIGETISDRGTVMRFVGPGLLTGQFDYPLTWSLRDAIALENTGLDSLYDASLESDVAYGPAPVMSAFVSSHDFPRFITFCDGDLPDPEIDDEKEVGWKKDVKVDHESSYDKQYMGLAYIMTRPGAPLLYYGDEIGMTGAGDPDNRRPMRFDDKVSEREKKLFEKVCELNRVRRENQALSRGACVSVLKEKDRLAFIKSGFQQKILCVFNRKPEECELSLKLPYGFHDVKKIKPLLKNGRGEAKKGIISITLPGRSVEFFELEY